jgi:hypothetical protein
MVDIDEEKLQNLMELVIKEHPDLDPYVVWIISANYLLNEQGIYFCQSNKDPLCLKSHL